MTPRREWTWHAAGLGEALELLAHRNGLAPRVRKAPVPPANVHRMDDRSLDRWLQEAAGWLGFEIEQVEVGYPELEGLLRRAGPALLRLRDGRKVRFLAIQGRRRRRVAILRPDHGLGRLEIRDFRAAVCEDLEAPYRGEVEAILRRAGVAGRDRAKASSVLLEERLQDARVSGCWLLRSRPGSGFLRQLARFGLLRHAVLFALTYTVSYLLWVASWWVVARSALEGRFDTGWLWAWAFFLLAAAPFQMLNRWHRGILAVGFGGLLKKRLLAGILRLAPEDVRGQGSGQSLGRVMEAEAFEGFTLDTGFRTLVAVIDLGVAFWFLTQGPALGAVWTFLLWLLVTFYLSARLFRATAGWTGSRIGMTNDLLERLAGHRTRLAQERRDLWHDEEDWMLGEYLERSRELDQAQGRAFSLMPRGWLVAGLLGVAPTLAAAQVPRLELALSLGGVLLAYRAFDRIRSGIQKLALAVITWRTVGPLFRAAARSEAEAPPSLGLLPAGDAGTYTEGRRLLEAHEIAFRHRRQGEAVLKKCSLEIRSGERILLVGASGSGKSTLASLLLGLRSPEMGTIFLHGLDRHSVGADSWRQRVTAAPQFQENHVFSGTLAFNLLMGRRWPPQPEDLREAEEICRELGLGPLLTRMPSGLAQTVGESGWQLSHGERSRLYVARALLQGAELILLDESFGTLDPENVQLALRCVFRRAATLLVIAHP